MGEGGLSEWAEPAVGAILALGAPVAIVWALIRQETVTNQTVLGALCLYLLAGMFFVFLYSTVNLLTSGRFFGRTTGTTTDYLYFSFLTLTTTGYGDLTEANDLGRMLAVTRGADRPALPGQRGGGSGQQPGNDPEAARGWTGPAPSLRSLKVLPDRRNANLDPLDRDRVVRNDPARPGPRSNQLSESAERRSRWGVFWFCWARSRRASCS